MILMKKANERLYLGIDKIDIETIKRSPIHDGTIHKTTIVLSDISVNSIERIVKFTKICKSLNRNIKIHIVLIRSKRINHRKLKKILLLIAPIDRIWTEKAYSFRRNDGSNGFIIRVDSKPYILICSEYNKTSKSERYMLLYNRCFQRSEYNFKLELKNTNDEVMREVIKMFNRNCILRTLDKTQNNLFGSYVDMVCKKLIKYYNIDDNDLNSNL